jgi:CxxC motif-containing protein (DUF1111 family)
VLAISVSFVAVGILAQENAPSIASNNAGNLDPGPRTGFVQSGNSTYPNNPGNPIQGLSADQVTYFANGLTTFLEQDGATLAPTGGGGLGPTFNSNSCGSCHSQPSPGGSSPSANAFPNIGQNPQLTVGQIMGGTNKVPFFITANGPVREARFKSDGGVHALFTIAGRSDAGSCKMSQPDFEAANASGNLSFRIPTPVFGAGLIENISDDTIMQNVAASASTALGIAGVPNRSGNDGTITRFGWKAQNKSLAIFAGEAYNVEMGVTNELFPSERGYPSDPTPSNCLLNTTPEDRTKLDAATPANVLSDVDSFAEFMRFLDRPIPACTGSGCSAPIQTGAAIFKAIGCANCHTPSLMTATSAIPGLSQVQANLFSDLALHHMGRQLADGISQGAAGPDQFRTAPLWGVGQRVFFLHDGRASNLVDAILEHQSQGSEANKVINNFGNLTRQQKQDLLLFLRSL